MEAEKNIVEGNKAIAKFMGCEMKPARAIFSDECGIVWGKLYENLEYHFSWEELMPVVEKIAKIVYEEGFEDGQRILETAYPRTFGMINVETGFFMVRFNRCCLFQAPTLIEVTWLAVVDFIKSKQEFLAYQSLNQIKK